MFVWIIYIIQHDSQASSARAVVVAVVQLNLDGVCGCVLFR